MRTECIARSMKIIKNMTVSNATFKNMKHKCMDILSESLLK